MYAKVKLPDGFVKGDCENCPLCAYHPSIDDTYDDDGYCNDDGFQDWDECLIKECTEDEPYNNVNGTKDYPQDNCPMEITENENSMNLVLPDDPPVEIVHEGFNTKSKIVCSTCNGSGEEPYDWRDPRQSICHQCHGSGYIKK